MNNEDKRTPIATCTSKKQFAFNRHKTGKVFISLELRNNTSQLDRSSDEKLKYGYQVCRRSATKGVLELEKFPYHPNIYHACRMINYVCALLFLKIIATP